MTKAVLFPGSFDPITEGHVALIRRALAFCDKVYVGVGVNSDKQYLFSVEERVECIRKVFPDRERVEPVAYSDMTIDLCHRLGVRLLLRGIRNSHDLEYEKRIAAVNQALDPSIETIILLADTEHEDISSTLLREQLTHGKNTKQP